ncbi:hypothetical protein [Chryseobacterium daeguense]|uniref:hypothetical protein n=1 Tax=Chryseobacterium daeguense TaxID=412438 RepID=UPI000414EED8|nr:hypothetical protein [Chryseobacterium daeguense]
MKKQKRKITITVEFENDKLPKTDDMIELEGEIIEALKEALNQDRFVIKNMEVQTPLNIKIESIII